MKQYRPNDEHQKWLYSMMKSRAVMRRRQGKPEGNADVAKGKKQIPDNSEPWLPGGGAFRRRRVVDLRPNQRDDEIMGIPVATAELTRELATRHRVLMLGSPPRRIPPPRMG
jgi:hypothetical protein